MKDTLADEERGELAFAAQCAQSILQWMGLTKEKAKMFVDKQGPYYLPGEDVIEIPASVLGLPDPILPQMHGAT